VVAFTSHLAFSRVALKNKVLSQRRKTGEKQKGSALQVFIKEGRCIGNQKKKSKKADGGGGQTVQQLTPVRLMVPVKKDTRAFASFPFFSCLL
jgi:hypothetical protein